MWIVFDFKVRTVEKQGDDVEEDFQVGRQQPPRAGVHERERGLSEPVLLGGPHVGLRRCERRSGAALDLHEVQLVPQQADDVDFETAVPPVSGHYGVAEAFEVAAGLVLSSLSDDLP